MEAIMRESHSNSRTVAACGGRPKGDPWLRIALALRSAMQTMGESPSWLVRESSVARGRKLANRSRAADQFAAAERGESAVVGFSIEKNVKARRALGGLR
jgi:hypothetical protein